MIIEKIIIEEASFKSLFRSVTKIYLQKRGIANNGIHLVKALNTRKNEDFIVDDCIKNFRDNRNRKIARTSIWPLFENSIMTNGFHKYIRAPWYAWNRLLYNLLTINKIKRPFAISIIESRDFIPTIAFPKSKKLLTKKSCENGG